MKHITNRQDKMTNNEIETHKKNLKIRLHKVRKLLESSKKIVTRVAPFVVTMLAANVGHAAPDVNPSQRTNSKDLKEKIIKIDTLYNVSQMNVPFQDLMTIRNFSNQDADNIIDSIFTQSYKEFFDIFFKETQERTSAICKVRGNSQHESSPKVQKEIREQFNAPHKDIPFGNHCSWCGNSALMNSNFSLNMFKSIFGCFTNVKATSKVFSDFKKISKQISPEKYNEIYWEGNGTNAWEYIKQKIADNKIDTKEDPQIFLVSENGHFTTWFAKDDTIYRSSYNRADFENVATYGYAQEVKATGILCFTMLAKEMKELYKKEAYEEIYKQKKLPISKIYGFTDLVSSLDGKTIQFDIAEVINNYLRSQNRQIITCPELVFNNNETPNNVLTIAGRVAKKDNKLAQKDNSTISPDEFDRRERILANHSPKRNNPAVQSGIAHSKAVKPRNNLNPQNYKRNQHC